jgi:IS30 family transposase
MRYQHLTLEERYQIYAYRQAGFSLRAIAAQLQRSASTISREIQRNRHKRGYRPAMAQRLAAARARTSRTRPRIEPRQWQGIAALVRQEWSPEQIAWRARHEGTLLISPTWIYRHIAMDRASGGQLWRHLRCQKRRRRYGSGAKRRTLIRHRVGIEQRPATVADRQELGHWEGDTIIGHRFQGAALTLVERTSRYLRIGRLPNLQAAHVTAAFRNRLHRLSGRVRTITLDNGTEFAGHAKVARALSANIYFADPYAPWQRGTNENTNGLIRQYLPKSQPLHKLTDAQVTRIERRLNHRPRKCLGFLTPHEVFNDTRQKLTVALRG